VDLSGPGTIRIGDDVLTLDDFQDRVASAVTRFADHRVVAVVASPTMRAVIDIVAAMTSGATVVPMGADSGEEARRHILEDSTASLLVDGDHETERQPATQTPRPPTDATLLLYTSGTTGPPKGVPITAPAIRSCVEGLAQVWAWTPDDILVHGLPLSHVHGLVLGVLGPIMLGSSLHHTGRPTPSAYADAAGTLYFGVPTVWSRVARDRAAARALSGARLLVSGSAALPAPTFDGLLQLSGHAPVERYGMTETLITLAARADAPRQRGTVGRPLPGIDARIVGEDGEPVAPNALGELQVRGRTVFAGYAGHAGSPDSTSDSFAADGWFRTGDVASVDADGNHRIVGRAATDLIKSGGYRIGAGEVEDALLSHPAVREAAVVGEPDDDLGQRIVAFVVAERVAASDLIRHVADRLSPHKRPRSIVFLDALPRNAMGKVDKISLRI